MNMKESTPTSLQLSNQSSPSPHNQEAQRLLQHSTKRWLTASEISHLLAFASTLPASMLSHSLSFRPPPGSLFLLDLDKKKGRWKDDGYKYERRGTTKGFREYSERIGEDKSLVCLYSCVDCDDEVYAQQSLGTDCKVQRRIYRLPELHPNLAIIHYFVSRKMKRTEDKLGEASTDIRASEEKMGTAWSSISADTGRVHNFDADGQPSHQRTDKLLSFSSGMDEEHSISEQSANKISELERQIADLKAQLAIEKTLSTGHKPRPKELLRVTITDFSPEWDYLQGGAKVIICFNPSRPVGDKAIKIVFGDNAVDGVLIQPNVVRCFGNLGIIQLRLVCSRARLLSVWRLVEKRQCLPNIATSSTRVTARRRGSDHSLCAIQRRKT
jgi:hypothetical protein